MVNSRSCHVFSGTLGLWKKDLKGSARKEGKLQQSKRGQEQGGWKCENRDAKQGTATRARQLKCPFSQHLSRCSAPQTFALTQLLYQSAGLCPWSQADAEKRGQAVRNRLWTHSRQDVGSTHLVQRTGNQNFKEGQT